MSKYTKLNSNYILRKKHQNIDKGVIFERDWTTLSEKHSLENGKKPYYSDGNFLFTTSNEVSHKKKFNTGEWDIKNISYNDFDNSLISSDKIYDLSNDLRDYVYYGSCVEMVRASIEDIIRKFPASLKSTDKKIYFKNNTFNEISLDKTDYFLYTLSNPFNIDMHHINPVIGEYDNEYRFMDLTWNNFIINKLDIKQYEINIINNEDLCKSNNKIIALINIKNYNDINYKIRVFNNNGYILLASEVNDLIIELKDNVKDDFFKSINGFEKKLLDKNTNPKYTTQLLTPIENENGIKYVNKYYTWPSDGFEIDINTNLYYLYLGKLIQIAQKYDELWCDNIYRNMTHESIKNFDFSYAKKIDNSEVQDNIDGGNRIEQLLKIYGRCFDEIKLYIDNINNGNNLSYERFNNVNIREIKNKLRMSGWDITNINQSILNKPLEHNKNIKWFDSLTTEYVDPIFTNSRFMKNLLLNSKKIKDSKGTRHSVEMILSLFGLGYGEDYLFNEEYYSVNPLDYYEIDSYGNKKISKTVSKIYELNDDIILPKSSDTEFSNLNLKSINLNNKKVVIPYYNKKEKYYNNDVFQSKGGWAYDEKQFKETVSYLKFVYNISELCDTNPNSVNINDIIYVDDISDYPTDDIINCTHFFYLKSNDTNKITSWENIKKDWENIKIEPDDSEEIIKEKENKIKLYSNSVYLGNIVTSSFGNNPHVGYGNYDNGKSFQDNMREPFKYIVDNNLFYNYENKDVANNINFNDSYLLENTNNADVNYNKKILIHSGNEEIVSDIERNYTDYIPVFLYKNIKIHNLYSGIDINVILYDKNKHFINVIFLNGTEKDIEVSIHDPLWYIRINFNSLNNKIFITDEKQNIVWTPYDRDKTKVVNITNNLYYINDKTFTLINLHTESKLYKDYFKKYILPYVMQVVPSSTIFKLINF